MRDNQALKLMDARNANNTAQLAHYLGYVDTADKNAQEAIKHTKDYDTLKSNMAGHGMTAAASAADTDTKAAGYKLTHDAQLKQVAAQNAQTNAYKEAQLEEIKNRNSQVQAAALESNIQAELSKLDTAESTAFDPKIKQRIQDRRSELYNLLDAARKKVMSNAGIASALPQDSSSGKVIDFTSIK
jgi:hypothetical protein